MIRNWQSPPQPTPRGRVVAKFLFLLLLWIAVLLAVLWLLFNPRKVNLHVLNIITMCTGVACLVWCIGNAIYAVCNAVFRFLRKTHYGN